MTMEVERALTHEVMITTEQTELIKKTICQGATDAEMQLFFYDCTRRGAHPLDKLIHFTKRKGKYTPITSIDYMRQRAHASGAYAGEDEATYILGHDGFPDSCTYVLYRFVQGQRCKWTATARWAEYYPGEEQGFMWRKMPFLMLSKCAEALALRKAFPEELQGLYVKEEMDQADRPLLTPKQTAQAKIHELRQEGAALEASGNGVSEGGEPADVPPPAPSDPPPIVTFKMLLDKLGLCETIREWSEIQNERLAAYQDGHLTPEQNAAIEKRADEIKKKWGKKS